MKRFWHLFAALLGCISVAAAGADFQALDRAAAARVTNPATHSAPTIVALWSSECVHCKKNLKLFAELAKAEPKLVLVTVAVEPTFDGLAEPLDRLGLPGARFAYGSESAEALGFALDPKWRGELPRTLLFDGRGGKTAVSGVLTADSVRKALGLAAR